jgi:hypothetical protein
MLHTGPHALPCLPHTSTPRDVSDSFYGLDQLFPELLQASPYWTNNTNEAEYFYGGQFCDLSSCCNSMPHPRFWERGDLIRSSCNRHPAVPWWHNLSRHQSLFWCHSLTSSVSHGLQLPWSPVTPAVHAWLYSGWRTPGFEMSDLIRELQLQV